MNSLAFPKSRIEQMRLALFYGLTFVVALVSGSSVNAQRVSIEPSFQVKTGTQLGVLSVELAVPEGWHCFSTTQLPGGPTKSTITISGKGVKVVGDFVPLEPPESHVVAEFNNLVCEEHQGFVVWDLSLIHI